MAVKVYGWSMSPFVSRALLCLEEAGVDYELVAMDMEAGDHRRPGHLARNPFGQVPVLEDGDLTIFESRAIGRHVLRKHKPELLGAGSLEDSAMVDMWLEVEAHQHHPAAGAIAFECVIAPALFGRARNQAVVDSFWRRQVGPPPSTSPRRASSPHPMRRSVSPYIRPPHRCVCMSRPHSSSLRGSVVLPSACGSALTSSATKVAAIVGEVAAKHQRGHIPWMIPLRAPPAPGALVLHGSGEAAVEELLFQVGSMRRRWDTLAEELDSPMMVCYS